MQFNDLHRQYLSLKDELDKTIQSVISNSEFIGGKHVEEFEYNFSNLLGVKHCISCGNGTDALYLAMRTLGVQPGDEVITTAHSWISTSETITQAGGKVIFCDTEPDYFCIDTKKIEQHITSQTKGIVVVHLYGQPADMKRIIEIARRHNLWVIEDCAQAHLAEYDGQYAGTFGDIATFSFYPGKNLGAMGDAGCLVTNQSEYADYARLLARHGGKNFHKIEGINSRMDSLQAAILNVKLPHLKAWTKLRRQHAAHYDALLTKIPDLVCPPVREGCQHVFHLYVIRADNREMLRAHLKAAEIPTLINYPKALPFYPAYARLNHIREDFPVACKHSEEILSLPLYPEMPVSDRVQVAQSLAAYYSSASNTHKLVA
ncbi:MAG: erythromycin biosynthesis sensory transduction protein eryC1 [Planctomycetaceae bacterium]|nr:erythromycin biosynthesis sensory transduction protein eryC1 [Planctomycetaceae bacterium]|tara:strand:- start:1130 stop:2251 length:1122 start_codon:yes stop_codon:yes gene_type:complete